MKSDTKGISTLLGLEKKFPNQITLPQYFSEGFGSGRLRPDNLALIDGEKQHTFQQLHDISTKISLAILECITDQDEQIKNLNPDGDHVIGVCMQPSDTLITILFAIIKTGGAYVPFDITFPEERIAKIVNDCRPLLIICDGKSNIIGKFANVRRQTNVVSTDELYKRIRPNYSYGLRTRFFENPKNENMAERTAVILYTSGSSGEPKGVRLSHRAIMNRLNWQWEQFPFIPREKCVFKTALTFVDSVAEIFGPLLQGFQVVVFDKVVVSQPPLFVEKLHAYEITRLVLVPSLLKAILQILNMIGKQEGRKLLGSVRLWICSGEALSYELLKEFFEHLPENFTLCNFYGSTEVMGDVTFISFPSKDSIDKLTLTKKTPIGFPIYNTSIHLLNNEMQPVDEGQLGEIFISGSNLATGYVGIPNSDKFLQIKTNRSTDLTTMYRTGDFGRIAKLPNGDSVLMYDGRIDSQIKVRGHRVDLSEVESVLIGFDCVSKANVLCYKPGQTDQKIVAYVVFQSSALYCMDLLKLKVEKSLREYERPIIRVLKEIPLLVNGKTDRQRLLKMFEAEVENREEFYNWDSLNIPKDKLAIAKTLFKIISNVTGTSLETIAENFNDSFFNIGGTSLNTVEVIVKLRKEKYHINISDFTSAFSIREIVMKISKLALSSQEMTTTPSRATELVRGKQTEYTILTLTDSDKEEAIHIISHSFTKKGDLEAYVNVTYSEYVTLITSIWNDIVDKQLSFIVRRVSNGKAVAVSFSFDVYDEPNNAECSEGIKYVMEFLEFVESQQRALLPKGKGKLLHSFMMGTPEDVDDSERVLLIEMMEEQNILIAKEKKFIGILTTNTNPLTMQIGRDLHGYEILCEYQVNEYVAPDGVKPFAVAPDSFKIICCWKRLV